MRASLVGMVVSIVAALAFSTQRADAEGLRIKVRGAAKITAHASRDQGELVLSGSLTDDAGEPLAMQTVTAHVTREADPHDPKVADALRGARGCETSADRPQRTRAWSVSVRGSKDTPEVLLQTDEDGRFCFRAKLEPDRFVADLHFRDARPNALLEPADTDLPFDLSRRSLALGFDPRPRILSLDASPSTFEALAMVDDDKTPRVAPGLPLVLATEDHELARVSTDASGRARFVVPSARLGPPGRGELRVSFAGDGETAKAAAVEPIERHVKVSMRVPAADRGELRPEVPEDGIALVAEVTSIAGPVGEGAIEAHVGDVIVGAAPVERGIARLTLTFAAQGDETLVALRYVPASPWFEPASEPVVRVPIRGPGLWSKAPILAAGLAVMAFFLASRMTRSRVKPEPRAPKPDGEQPDGTPKMELVREAGRGERGWRGRVVDAHEGTPVANARVSIERGTFEGLTVLASAVTDARGEFVIDAAVNVVGDERLCAEARLHARLAQPLPGPGVVSIALAQRRRALLARMVKWAKRRGTPFDARPEPTPGHVRRAAGDDQTTASWADAVERAAFGGSVVDERLEREIDQLAPDEANPSIGRAQDETE